jgi:hypothetical protein
MFTTSITTDVSIKKGRNSFAGQKKINRYAKAFQAFGFRAGAMYRNLDWYEALEFSYDMSVPNVAHLDPQRGGCCTVMPYFIGNILELPLTTTQDYSLFHIIGDYSTKLWKQQIKLVLQKHGLISFGARNGPTDLVTSSPSGQPSARRCATLGRSTSGSIRL